MESSHFLPTEVAQLPHSPGVYRFFNKEGTVIYVGKAKSLKNRVSSYFQKAGDNRKTRRMVSEVQTIEVTVVNSEFDALLLENNIIKQLQPKYNILLRDDKTFPYIVVTHERFPRLFSTRKRTLKGVTYYGPYASVKAMNNVLRLVRSLYTIRTCRLDLSEAKVAAGKYSVCLEYHIGNCLGPCEGKQTEDDYLADIHQAEEILKGRLNPIRAFFTERMNQAAGQLAFEKAAHWKRKLDLLEKFQARSMVASPKIRSLDVFTIDSLSKVAFVNYMHIVDGAVVTTKTVELKKKLDESDEEVLAYAILALRDQYGSEAKEVIANIAIDLFGDDLPVSVPKIGDKKKLLELSQKNTDLYKSEWIAKHETTSLRIHPSVEQLQQDLRMNHPPLHIECFDNSNFQGSSPVASMVLFRNGRPSKKEYRHFNIKTVKGPDDFASMREIVARRYRRLLAEDQPLPDVVLIDGGKGQLSAAAEALKEVGAYGRVVVIGIAKRLEELYYPEDELPLHINKKSQGLRLLQHLRDEAHRFAITHHRQQRSKTSLQSELDAIQGIGPATREKLLKHFRSAAKISSASLKELSQAIGPAKAETVHLWYQHKKRES